MSEKDKELDDILSEIKNNKTEGAEESKEEEKDTENVSKLNDEIKDEIEEEPAKEDGTDELHFDEETEVIDKEESPEDDGEFQIEETKSEDLEDLKEGLHDIEEIPAEEITDLEEDPEVSKPKKKNNKKAVIAIVAIVLIIAIGVGVYFAFFNKAEEPAVTTTTTTETTIAPEPVINPLTGEDGFAESAVGKRPVAIVVENQAEARPQYNLGTADIVVEGEVEGGITRMLWLYADMSSLPEMVGPTRSARPSYVEFSEFFDSIFVHFGGSHSKGNYVGGYDVIKNDGVDDIDGMTDSACFKRTSDKASPHNAVLLGNKIEDVIKSKGYDTDIDESSFSTLNFTDDFSTVSDTACNTLKVTFSSRTNSYSLKYNADKKQYENGVYGKTVGFTNAIIISANTTYITKNNYQKAGNSVTYVNYDYSNGGSGYYATDGTVEKITWEVKDNKLSFKDESGKDLKINVGKTWIGLVSANNKGAVSYE